MYKCHRSTNDDELKPSSKIIYDLFMTYLWQIIYDFKNKHLIVETCFFLIYFDSYDSPLPYDKL
jgi:hypothetical protein